MAMFCMLAGVACSDDPTDAPYSEPVPPEVTLTRGEVSETTAEVIVSAENADRVACMHLLADAAEEIPTAEEIFLRDEFAAEFSGSEIKYLIEGLEAETDYVVYAAASSDAGYSEVKMLQVTTMPHALALSFVEATKTSFTYKVDVPDRTVFQHGYIEGWYFDALLAEAQRNLGSEFDMNVFLWNMLVDFGYEATGPQVITWRAGDENLKRDGISTIVGGKKYYALYSLYEAENNWLGTPEAVAFETAPAGASDATIALVDEEVTPTSVKVRMEADPQTVHFFYYDLYTKESFDERKAEIGQEGIMDYLYEYGYVVPNTYTDVWTVNPESSYMLAIMGVDRNGDLFYVEKQYDSLPLEPEFSVAMRPFERELQGYHAYDTFEVLVTASNFKTIDAQNTIWLMQPKVQVDAMLQMFGMTLETLAQMPEYLAYLGAYPLPEDCASQFESNGYFLTYLTDYDADTEYCFLCATPCDGVYKLAYAIATTEPAPQTGVVDEEYRAFLGEWTLKGQSTEDFYSPKSYNLRFEELTPNRSYKVYGWSDSQVAQEFPFEVRYHSDTKKITIEGHQLLGTTTLDGKDVQVFFDGFLMDAGYLQLAEGFTGPVYTGSVNENSLSLFPELVMLGNRYYEFNTMSYTGYDAAGDVYYTFPGDAHQIVNFIVKRPTRTAAKNPLSVGHIRAARVVESVRWQPATEARPLAPAAPVAGSKQPAVFSRR